MSEGKDSINVGGYYAFIGSFIFSIGLIVYLSFIYEGIDLNEVREQVDSADGTVTEAFDINKVEAPWESSEQLIAHGEKVYQMNCATCHGKTGKGDGPGAAAMNPKPRNFVEGNWAVGGTSIDLYKTTSEGLNNGSTGMVGFSFIPKNDRWAIVHYIRSITENKPEDNPEELAEFGQSAN